MKTLKLGDKYKYTLADSLWFMYDKDFNLFHAEIMGIKYTFCHKELQYLSDLIAIMLRDNPENKV